VTVQLTRAQLIAFMALIVAVVMVTLAPVVVTGIMGKVVPDSLVAVSDKCITGLIGVLGTLVGVMWQSRPKTGEPMGTPTDPVNTRDVTP